MPNIIRQLKLTAMPPAPSPEGEEEQIVGNLRRRGWGMRCKATDYS